LKQKREKRMETQMKFHRTRIAGNQVKGKKDQKGGKSKPGQKAGIE